MHGGKGARGSASVGACTSKSTALGIEAAKFSSQHGRPAAVAGRLPASRCRMHGQGQGDTAVTPHNPFESDQGDRARGTMMRLLAATGGAAGDFAEEVLA